MVAEYAGAGVGDGGGPPDHATRCCSQALCRAIAYKPIPAPPEMDVEGSMTEQHRAHSTQHAAQSKTPTRQDPD